MVSKGAGRVGVVATWLLVVMVVGQLRDTAAANCNPLEVSPCLAAIAGYQQPSPECCARQREQALCLCGYLNNPSLRPYSISPGHKRLAGICGVRPAKC